MFIKFLAPEATSSLPVSNCAVLATSAGGESAELAVPGREFIGEPVTEFGCVRRGKSGCMTGRDPEFIVRCGGRDAPDDNEAAASEPDSVAGEPDSASLALVDDLVCSLGVIARNGMLSGVLLLIVYVVVKLGQRWQRKPCGLWYGELAFSSRGLIRFMRSIRRLHVSASYGTGCDAGGLFRCEFRMLLEAGCRGMGILKQE